MINKGYNVLLENLRNCVSLIIPSLHCLTELEARNLGIFLFELFNLMSSWLNKSQLKE